MEENFTELLVARKQKGYEQAAKAGAYVLCAVFVLGGMFWNPLSFIGALAMILVIWRLVPRLFVEYEYLLVNQDLQIDAIYSKETRKRQRELNLRDAELLYRDNGKKETGAGTETVDYSTGDAADPPYILVIPEKGKRVQYRLSLSGEMLERMKTAMGIRFRS